jgi:cell division protease FtsH
VLSDDDAVEVVYRDELTWAESRLRQGMSVLIECDKQLTLYLYKAICARLRRQATQQVRCSLISGHHPPAEDEAGGRPRGTLTQRVLLQLQDAVLSGDDGHVVVLPHLDVLTTTTRTGLTAEAREAAAILYENPAITFLGFKDPAFEIPKVIQEVFPARCSCMGISRERLPRILLQQEARKLAVDTINPYHLCTYLSGSNAIRARQILSHLQDREDYDPAAPESARSILHDIRRMTAIGDVELPSVDLDEDIGGYEPVKQKIQAEILDLLAQRQSADPETARHIDEIVPKGIILHGPPGTGKTFFAKAIATALDATITIVSGPELKSRWEGESEASLRRIFARARRAAPSIIVFDELDSFAGARGTYTGSGVEHSMVNQLLAEMDGFRKDELVFVIGTTNFVEALDGSLLRPGRFELSIQVPYPNERDRRDILEMYRQKFHLNIDERGLTELVRLTGGYVDTVRGIRYSGDHLYAVMRALKRAALRRGDLRSPIDHTDLVAALDQRSQARVTLNPAEEQTVAIHEAGHAIAAYILPDCPPIEKISIATGNTETLGYVMQSVKDRRYITTRKELLDDVCVLLAGREAEEMVLGDISVGAWNDLQQATEVCRLMVEELGMSNIGPRSFRSSQDSTVDRSTRSILSNQIAYQIDAEINRLLDEARRRAADLLRSHRHQLNILVQRLLDEKTADINTMDEIFGR